MQQPRVCLPGGPGIARGQGPQPIIPSTTSHSLAARPVIHRNRSQMRELLVSTFRTGLPAKGCPPRSSQALWQICRTLWPCTVLLAEAETISRLG